MIQSHRRTLVRFRFRPTIVAALCVVIALGIVAARAAGDEKSGQGSNAQPSSSTGHETTAESLKLDESEAGLSRRYRQFERTLMQMAEYLRKTEPERANLLIRAIGKSKDEAVIQQMDRIVELLKNDQFGDAIGHQQHLVVNLRALLELLQSEDRRHQLEEDKKWYETVQKEVGKLSAREKELRKATEGTGKLGPLAERQAEIGKDTKSLIEKIDQQDATRNGADRKKGSDESKSAPGGSPSDKGNQENAEKKDNPEKGEPKSDSKSGKDGKGKEGDKPDSGKSQADKGPSDKAQSGKSQAEKKQTDKKAADKKSSEKNPPGKNGSKQPGSKGQKSQDQKSQDQKKGKPNKGQPNGEGEQPSDQQSEPSPPSESESESADRQQPRKTPGREEIEQARRAMQKAEEHLKKLQGEKALEQQDEAIRKLAEARERLEKILRQLREEEQEIMLASLEARFAKMLLVQLQIHVDTTVLAKTKKGEWTPKHYGRTHELGVMEDTIANDAGKALALLKEEGSSVAFPKGVEQLRDDMLSVARRLEKEDVGELTQSIEKDIIESLEELVAALQSEMENRKKPENQRRAQRGQAGQNPDKSLVEQIAELKMLRSLQMRVNRRTKLIGRFIKGEQAMTDDLTRQLRDLAQRQAEIQEATYILASERNK